MVATDDIKPGWSTGPGVSLGKSNSTHRGERRGIADSRLQVKG